MNDTQRISRNEYYSAVALITSLRSTCGRAQVGCAIVKDGRIISVGYNGSLPNHLQCTEANCKLGEHCKISVHAEANAIAWAAKEGIALKGSSIYCTHLPCLKCTELIIQAGIVEVNYMISYRITDGLEKLKASGIIVNNLPLIGFQFNPDFYEWSIT